VTGWILVLTIITNDYRGGSAIATVEFNSKTACVSAGNEWANATNRIKGNEAWVAAFARCYEKGEAK
jgi:hypothetical protein